MAALFYGQAQASAEDVDKLSELLNVSKEKLAGQMTGFPDRGRSGPMPPVEPLIYRLYEVVQNYGYAYKAILNEKFGDGIMSAICFSTKVDKEVDESGAPWVVITMKGKWLVPLHLMASRGSSCPLSDPANQRRSGSLSPDSRTGSGEMGRTGSRRSYGSSLSFSCSPSVTRSFTDVACPVAAGCNRFGLLPVMPGRAMGSKGAENNTKRTILRAALEL